MATGKSGYFDLSTTKANVKVRINWSETYEISTNASVPQIDSVQVMALSPYGYYGYTYYPDGSIKIGGNTVVTFKPATPSHSVRVAAQDAWYSISGAPYTSGSISHNADGSKSVTIAVDITGYTNDGSGDSGWRATGSKTVELTTIPRASTIGATDANVGATSIIAVNRKSTAYTHSVAYKFGSLSGYINADGETVSSEVKITETNIAFSIPTSWYDQIGSAQSGVCTLTCKTYSGSTQIGNAQTETFTVTASQSASAPTVSGTVKDTNTTTTALTGSADRLVRYFSAAQCTISATAKNGASITEKTVNGNAISGTSITMDAVETGEFVFEAKDSRGYTGMARVSKTLVEYIKLTETLSCTRDDPTSGNATLMVTGNYFNGSFGAKSNALTIKYRIGTSGSWYAVAAGDISYSAVGYIATVALSGLDYQKSHRIYVTVEDKLMSLSKSMAVDKGIPIAHWGENDFCVERMLFAYNSQTVSVSGHYYNGSSDTSETALNTWLDNQMSGMTDMSVRDVAFRSGAFGTGAVFYGRLCRHNANYAVLYGFNYVGYALVKYRDSNGWQAAKKQLIGG